MKTMYEKPMINLEEFVPNESVAVCTMVQLPGTNDFVEAFDVQATAFYADCPSTGVQEGTRWPIFDLNVTSPVFFGSFKVKTSNGEIKEYTTSDGNYGDPDWNSEYGGISDLCVHPNTQWYDGYHYHYIGYTTNHS